ncbi:MAG TPA: hypothetical protein VFW87_16050 [Pirellulales bacterium]|nr:hypothetical protein [Pirellulales bacterium]
MGLELLDILFRIEQTFHIDVSKEEIFDLTRNNDIIVGDLYEFILQKLHLRDFGRYDVRLNEGLWLEMQSVLQAASGAPLEQIELGLALEVLFPRETRRAQWNALREICPYKIRELDYSRFIRVCGFLLAAGVVVVEHGQIWQIPGAKWFWPFLGLFGVWMVSETYLKVLSVFAPLRNCFPKRMRTVKDLCRNVLSANYAEICKTSASALDERCSAVWEHLVEILVDSLGVEPGEVTFRSRLIADLNAS